MFWIGYGRKSAVNVIIFTNFLLLLPAVSLAQEADRRVLTLGDTRQHQLAWGDSHTWFLDLKAGDFFHITVQQNGVDLTVEVKPPGQEPRHTWDSEGGATSTEAVYGVAQIAGTHQIKLISKQKDRPPGAYTLHLKTLKPAKPQDRWLAEAKTAFSKALALHYQGTKTALTQAADAYQTAIGLWRKLADQEEEANTLNNLARIKEALGDRQTALTLFQEALALWKKTPNRAGLSRTLNNIGDLYTSTGKQQDALGFFTQALEIRKELQDHRGMAVTINNLGTAYARLGKMRESLAFFQKAMPLFAHFKDRSLEGNILTNQGFIYNILGESQKALNAYQKALPLREAVGDKRGQAHTLNNLAMVYRGMGDPQGAVPRLQKALALYREMGTKSGEAVVLMNLGQCEAFLQRFDKAEAYLTQAIGLFAESSEKNGLADALNNLGTLKLSQGDSESALQTLQEALAQFKQMGNRYGVGRTQAVLADAFLAAGNHEKALQLATEARRSATVIGDEAGLAQAWWSTGRVHFENSRHGEAADALTKAITHLEQVREKVKLTDLRTSLLASKRQFYSLLMQSQIVLAQKTGRKSSRMAALETSERARARGLLELLKEAGLDLQHGISASLKAKEQALFDQIALQQRKLRQLQSNPKATPEILNKAVGKLGDMQLGLEQLAVEIRQKHGSYAGIRYPEAFRGEEFTGLIDSDTAVLEYFLGEEQAFLFCLTAKDLTIIELGATQTIDRQVTAIRQYLGKPGTRSFARFVPQARQLFGTLLAKALPAIGDAKNLVIIADGSLHYLPFECLIRNDVRGLKRQKPQYVVHKWNTVYVNSLAIWRELKAKKGQIRNWEHQFVAIADPTYPTAQGNPPQLASLKAESRTTPQPSFKRLVHSAREVRGIAQYFPPAKVTLFLGKSASETRVKKSAELSKAKYVHFGTHGVLNEMQPLLSGLVLADEAKHERNGLLQSYEIFNMPLSADLVVLSACETGLGKAVKGEGLIGLSRAFFYAGATSLAVSLWRVADQSTADFMIGFYKNLQESQSKAMALRQAKLALMEDTRYQHPYFWAPFVLTGDPQ